MKKYLAIFLLGVPCLWAKAQVVGEVNVLDRDVFYLSYTPPNMVTDDFNFQRLNTKVGLPPIRGKRVSVFNTLGLDVYHFNYTDDSVGEGSPGLANFYNLNYSLMVAYKVSDRWSAYALAAPFLLSNLEGSLASADFNVNGHVLMERSFPRKNGGYYQVGLGISYLTVNGNTALTPISHVKALLNERWSFVVGLPNTYVKRKLGERGAVKALLDFTDFSAHLGGQPSTGLAANADRAVFTVAAAGIEYNYWAKPALGFMARATQAVWGDYALRDDDGEDVHQFDADFRQPILTLGIKYNPNRQAQHRLKPRKR